jgi:hypothetical protein
MPDTDNDEVWNRATVRNPPDREIREGATENLTGEVRHERKSISQTLILLDAYFFLDRRIIGCPPYLLKLLGDYIGKVKKK